uniref:Uncharacterized protein n=1 Tax=Zea mays TaxID=4577 RepID=A0A804PZQ2_MAIZE
MDSLHLSYPTWIQNFYKHACRVMEWPLASKITPTNYISYQIILNIFPGCIKPKLLSSNMRNKYVSKLSKRTLAGCDACDYSSVLLIECTLFEYRYTLRKLLQQFEWFCCYHT